ncbi:V-type proton ATPase subunit C isoform X2 [Drosophila serrata]|uniref:V-type proton ATPase subunit C isoform X2 n=1 Tax=Drosophila serrata TaxID=7274 RepID=UPI000A1D24FB|nr:V-type proton ATPase subunit C isoform X2 [Drosophila serrata]
MMSEYWIISAPGDKTCQQTYDTMNNLTSKQHNLCNNYKFHIPDLKVGTLDQLVGLSDDLGKLDTYVEQITRKVANYLGEVLEDQRDKLHENLMANNSPGPPDDSMPCRHHQRIKHLSLRHQRKHQHTHHQNKPQHYHHHHHHQLPQDLKGKSAPSSQTTACSPATPPPPNLPPPTPACACISADALAPGHGHGSVSGGSLTNLSSSHDPEPEFDACPCDECFACAPPSTSATASTLLADECYSQTASSMLSATRCALSTVAAIATGSGLGSGPSTSAAAAAASTGGVASSSACSSAYFSTSAPTTSSSVHSSMSRSNSKRLNNNTCSINNNKLSFRSGSHVSQLHLPTHQQHQSHHQLHHPPPPGHLHSHPNPLQSPTQKSVSEDEGDVTVPDDGETDGEDPKSPNSVQSDLSDTFDWWFNKPKRNSKKSRSSPVSSCCGSSSQGRSSPDTDPAEPPEFPLSPG